MCHGIPSSLVLEHNSQQHLLPIQCVIVELVNNSLVFSLILYRMNLCAFFIVYSKIVTSCTRDERDAIKRCIQH